MLRILILFAHPALRKSRVQRALLAAVPRGAGITLHDLYDAYPDYDIDVQREQALLLDHDVVIMQHPFYWYSTPPMLKQWQDLVLEHGWAYGARGRALQGKTLLNVLSTGGPERSYSRQGAHRRTIRELLCAHRADGAAVPHALPAAVRDLWVAPAGSRRASRRRRHAMASSCARCTPARWTSPRSQRAVTCTIR
jgi:glutathione-regulated potassium-efflux system ancillary protein KefG